METTAQIRSWHVHVYFDGAAQRERAAALREKIAARFEVQLGRWHEVPVGPHSRAMYQVAFETRLFASLVPWLALNRQGLDLLVHPNTLAPRADHLQHALWMGAPLPIRQESLPEAIGADQEDMPQVNTRPDVKGPGA